MMGVIFVGLSVVLLILIALLLNEKPSQKEMDYLDSDNDKVIQVRTIQEVQNTPMCPAPRVIQSTTNPSTVKTTTNGIRVKVQAKQNRNCFHCGHMNKNVEEKFVCNFCGRNNDGKTDRVKVIC